MANSWFRLYSEFAHDPKVQMLSETDQRRYVMLLCLRCNGDVTLHETEVAFQLRISEQEWIETKARLVEKKLIGDDNNPTAWNKRQFVSDSSRARVQRHREKKKTASNGDVTLQQRRCNAVDTDTDTDISTTDVVDKARDKKPPRFDARAHLVNLGVDAQIAQDWLTHRQAKKARPTITAISGIAREAAKARIALSDALSISCQRGWIGFEAAWIEKTNCVNGHKSERQIVQDAQTRAIFGDSLGAREKLIIG
jgi:hypothetical protein